MSSLYPRPKFGQAEEDGVSQLPRRSRKNIVMLCRAVIKYAEGPGEIDSLVNSLCDTLGDLAYAMRGAHERALAELLEAENHREMRERVLLQAPSSLLDAALLEELEARGLLEEVEIPEGWDELEEVVG